MNPTTLMLLATPRVKAMRREIAAVFRKASPGERCALALTIEAVRARYHRRWSRYRSAAKGEPR